MEREILEKVANCLLDEFQSMWLIDIEAHTMEQISYNTEESIPDSRDMVEELCSYEKCCKWYIENCIIENDRERIAQLVTIDNIVENILQNKTYHLEYSRINGEAINYNQLFFSGIYDEDGQIMSILLGFRDIDVRKKTQIDDLTGVYTRQYFFQKAEELLSKYPDVEFDLEVSDIVDFKKINELYGVKTGDRILRWNGSQLVPLMSDKVLVGRFGGDQFVMMAPHGMIQEHFDKNDFSIEPYLESLREINLPEINLKFGVYEKIPHDKPIVSICDKAHLAIKSIKSRYDKCVARYSDKLEQKLDTRRKMEKSMYQSLKEKHFKVYYQPKHDATTGDLVGAEALVRWIHPEFGFMSPGDFIPLFEENGFIVELDNYVWNRTCENLKAWKEQHYKQIPISVNASKLTFDQPDLLSKMQKAVADNGVSADMLHIEITETMMPDDIDMLVNKLLSIKDSGFQIELDDFGSGYTSMNILSTLPIDIVKLDMSFMKQFGDEKRAKVLVACINLANELGYKTVSEGVELKEQKDLLSILGVDYIQGYYFSKPLPEEEFEEYMQRYGA